MDVLRGRRGEEDGGAGDVLGLAPAAGRDAVEDRLVAGRVGAQRLGVVGLDVAGRDRVDVDALRRPLVGEQLGQAGDAVLGRGVGRDADAALEGEQRGDVDDRAARPAREGGAGEGLRQEEHRLQVDVDHLVPVGLAEVDGVGPADDAGVVDEDVERTEGRERLRRGRRLVEREPERPAPAAPRRRSGRASGRATTVRRRSPRRRRGRGRARSPGRCRCWRR